MSPASIALAVFLGIVVFYWVLMSVLAFATGWKKLAKSYGTDAAPPRGERSTWESIRLRAFGNYNACLVMVFSSMGLYLVPFLPFRAGHRALLIPWSRIRHVKDERVMGTECTRLEVATDGKPIRMLMAKKTWDLGERYRG
jgi:hypothetical protein